MTLAFVVKEGACVFSALHLVSNVLDVSLIVLGRRCLVWWVLDDNQFVEQLKCRRAPGPPALR